MTNCDITKDDRRQGAQTIVNHAILSYGFDAVFEALLDECARGAQKAESHKDFKSYDYWLRRWYVLSLANEAVTGQWLGAAVNRYVDGTSAP